MSLIFMVFMAMPIIAPGVGQVLLLTGPWQSIFVFMAGLATLISLWPSSACPRRSTPNTAASSRSSRLPAASASSSRTGWRCSTALPACSCSAPCSFRVPSQQIFVDIFGRRALPRRLRGHGGNDGCLVVPQFAHRPRRHAPAEPFRADRLYQRQHPPRRLQPGGLHAALAVLQPVDDRAVRLRRPT